MKNPLTSLGRALIVVGVGLLILRWALVPS